MQIMGIVSHVKYRYDNIEEAIEHMAMMEQQGYLLSVKNKLEWTYTIQHVIEK